MYNFLFAYIYIYIVKKELVYILLLYNLGLLDHFLFPSFTGFFVLFLKSTLHCFYNQKHQQRKKVNTFYSSSTLGQWKYKNKKDVVSFCLREVYRLISRTNLTDNLNLCDISDVIVSLFLGFYLMKPTDSNTSPKQGLPVNVVRKSQVYQAHHLGFSLCLLREVMSYWEKVPVVTLKYPSQESE